MKKTSVGVDIGRSLQGTDVCRTVHTVHTLVGHDSVTGQRRRQETRCSTIGQGGNCDTSRQAARDHGDRQHRVLFSCRDLPFLSLFSPLIITFPSPLSTLYQSCPPFSSRPPSPPPALPSMLASPWLALSAVVSPTVLSPLSVRTKQIRSTLPPTSWSRSEITDQILIPPDNHPSYNCHWWHK